MDEEDFSMFQELLSLNERPKPFSVYSVDELWTDPHLSHRMLEFHLDAEGDMASRQSTSIDQIVE